MEIMNTTHSIRASFAISALTITALIACIGCGEKVVPTADGRIPIVATTGMIADAIQAIGGDNVKVVTLMGPGVDPHLYKATKGDVDELGKARLIMFNGLHLEGKMGDVLSSTGVEGRGVSVGEFVPDSLLRHPAEFEGNPDPHIWFDLSIWSYAVEGIGKKLGEVDPKNRTQYDSLTARYLDSLNVLHGWIMATINSIPDSSRVLVTAHDAFGYYGKKYGLEVRGLQGISTATEAGLLDVTAMVDFLVGRKIKAVFVESSVSPKTIEAVIEGCIQKGHEIRIGGQLYSDAMGSPDDERAITDTTLAAQLLDNNPATFFGMVRHNTLVIAHALK